MTFNEFGILKLGNTFILNCVIFDKFVISIISKNHYSKSIFIENI